MTIEHEYSSGRRRALRQIGAVTASAILEGCVHTPPTPRPIPAPQPPLAGCPIPTPGPPPPPVCSGAPLAAQIDVHCHVFNVRDVPAYSIIEDAMINNVIVRLFASPLVLLATRVAYGAAPSYDEEKTVLGGMAAGRPFAALAHERPSNDEIFAAGFVKFIRLDTSFGTGPRRSDTLENDQLVLLLLKLFPLEVNPLPLARQSYEGWHTAGTSLYAKFASRLQILGADIADYIAQFFYYFAIEVSKYRYQLAGEASNLLPTAIGTARLVTPATLDVANWLPNSDFDLETTPLPQQSELMRLISLYWLQATPPALVHGFIAFDPWQYVDDVANHRSPNALDVVDTALTRDGFIGVKLYPTMGFRATGNADRPDSEFLPRLTKDHSNLGRSLDDALDTLYAYCVNNDVPIMAHCAASVGPTTDTQMCADPLYWREVLLKPQFKMLRLNLGHFGGVWDYNQALNPEAAGDVGWTAYIARMIQEDAFPYLYTDFGDFATILGRSDPEKTDRKRILANLRHLVRCFPKIRERIMYGTDWLMLGIEPGFDMFYQQMRDQLATTLAMCPEDLFWKNAARYLGLADNDKTRLRLRSFYTTNHLDPDLLNPFRP